MQTTPPVIFLIFNRPSLTARVFERIRRARPKRLFVVADGPRPGYPDDERRCAAARSVLNGVDWPCEVLEHYSDVNLGCGRRVSSGITWAFEHVEEAIILEDDCVPHPSFFVYCGELLDRYRNEGRVMCVTGDNFQNGTSRGDASYYFSKYPHCWGWATWRSSWRSFDLELKRWPEARDTEALRAVCPHKAEYDYWSSIFSRCHRAEIDSWAYPWTFACWMAGGLTATPNVNLVSNIGFGQDATHTTNHSHRSEMPVFDLGEIRHPDRIDHDDVADQHVFHTVFQPSAPTKPRFRRLAKYCNHLGRPMRNWLGRRPTEVAHEDCR